MVGGVGKKAVRGRRGIGDAARSRRSLRAASGELEVKKDVYFCRECAHNKVFVKSRGVFCCRCGVEVVL